MRRRHLRLAVASLATLAALAATRVAACDLAPDPRSYAQRLADEPLVFVGTVTAVNGREVRFAVHHTLRGMPGEAVSVQALPPSTCAISFEVGQRWLYAGVAVNQPSVLLLANARGVPASDFGRLARVDDTAARWPAQWQACTRNDQCEMVAIACQYSAVHTAHAAQANAQSIRMLGDHRAMSCATLPPEIRALPAPQCVASRCGLWLLDLRRKP